MQSGSNNLLRLIKSYLLTEKNKRLGKFLQSPINPAGNQIFNARNLKFYFFLGGTMPLEPLLGIFKQYVKFPQKYDRMVERVYNINIFLIPT